MSHVPEKSEKQDQGVVVEYYHDNQIVVFEIPDMKRRTLDVWADLVIEMTQTREKSIYYLHYFVGAYALTPYMTKKADYIQQKNPEGRGFIAIAFKESLLAKSILPFINRTVANRQPSITNKIFTDRDNALAWLIEKFEANRVASKD